MADETILADGVEDDLDGGAPEDSGGGAKGEGAQDPKPAGDGEGGPKADDWRARFAGEDKKLMGWLGRYPSEKAFAEAAKKDRESLAQNRLVKLPENPTDEEVAAYRKANGIPEEAAGYFGGMGEMNVGDDDKPAVEQFLDAMHAQNAPQGLVNAAIETYYKIVEDQQAAEADADRAMQSESIEVLREEWGPDYKRNINAMHGYLDTLPESVKTAFTHGRDADGRPLGYNPDVLKWLASKALEDNPLATVVPNSGQTSAQAVDARIAEIENTMRENRPAYNRDEKMQAEYRDLISMRERAKNKGA